MIGDRKLVGDRSPIEFGCGQETMKKHDLALDEQSITDRALGQHSGASKPASAMIYDGPADDRASAES